MGCENIERSPRRLWIARKGSFLPMKESAAIFPDKNKECPQHARRSIRKENSSSVTSRRTAWKLYEDLNLMLHENTLRRSFPILTFGLASFADYTHHDLQSASRDASMRRIIRDTMIHIYTHVRVHEYLRASQKARECLKVIFIRFAPRYF